MMSQQILMLIQRKMLNNILNKRLQFVSKYVIFSWKACAKDGMFWSI